MSFNADQLFNLLPAVHRLRDAEQGGGALKSLIAIIADQVAVLESELDQLEDNYFVETAAPWVLPYLGDLLGMTGLGGIGHTHQLAPRAEIANTIAYRRRKGTAAVLEQLARDATGWPSAAVEFFQRLATTQHVNHVRPKNRSWLSLRNAKALEFLDTPFEDASRTIEVRRIQPGLGKWNIPNIGIFLWRLQAYSHTRSPLASAHLGDDRHFRFHPLGLDVPLCLNPATETEIAHLAEPKNVPLELTRRLLTGERLRLGSTLVEPPQFHPDAQFYGMDSESSLLVELPGTNPGDPPTPISSRDILVCNLHDVHDAILPGNPIVRWGHDETNLPGKKFDGKILLDPARGRIVFPGSQTVAPLATFYTLFPADLGGGEYARTGSFDRDSSATRLVSQLQPPPASQGNSTIAAAITSTTSGNQIIEITDSGNYVEKIPELVATGRSLELRAADGSRPVVTLGQPLLIGGDANGSVTLNGLLLTGAAMEADGVMPAKAPIEVLDQLAHVRLRHCTVLPGLIIQASGELDTSVQRLPALTLNSPNCEVEIENCILGPILAGPDARVTLKNCIVDAGSASQLALGSTGKEPGGTWRIEKCTIIGNVDVRVIELASNSIFLGTSVTAAHRQEGCVRFSWLEKSARVPRRHKCLPRDEIEPLTNIDLNDIRPLFSALQYGKSSYCQLHLLCPEPILRGADDDSEQGVYHDLFQMQRQAQLQARLQEYLRFGLEAGVFYVT